MLSVTHATVLHTGAMHGTTLHTTQVLCMCVVLDTGTMYTVLPPYIVLMLLSCVLCYLACMLVCLYLIPHTPPILQDT